MIREAAVLRGVRVRLLISFWRRTHPLTFNFVTSLRSLCTQLINCSIEVVGPAPLRQTCSARPSRCSKRQPHALILWEKNLLLQKFFGHKERSDDLPQGLNHNKYMVTDNAVYIGRPRQICRDVIPFN